MRLFGRLYERVMQWSRAERAPWFLAGLSFAESSFFPVPPDVMLAPMSLAEPRKAWRLAALTTVASVAGGLLGYVMGVFLFGLIEPWLHRLGYWDEYLQARAWFDQWGFWAIFVAGFSPIPYKIFTITAGTLAMPLLPFAAASLIGRGARFYLVAGLLAWGGPRLERVLREYIERIGWAMVGLVVVAYLVVRY